MIVNKTNGNKHINNYTIENCATMSVGLYIASIFVFNASVELNFISQLLFLHMVVWWMIYIVERQTIIINGAMMWFLTVLVLSTVSIVWSIDFGYATSKLKTVIQLVFMGIVVNSIVDNKYKINIFTNSVIISGYFMYIYTFAMYGIDGIMSMFGDDIRLGGEINQENTFGYYSALVFSFSLYQLIYRKNRKHLILLPLPVIMGLLSGSKKSLLLLIIISLVLLTLRNRKNIIKNGVVAIGCVVFAGFVLYRLGFLDLVLERLATAVDGTDNSTNQRQVFINFGLDLFGESPIWGYGIEQFAVLFNQEYGDFSPAHNNYIQILTSFGIIGFLLWYGAFIFFLYISIKNFYKSDVAPILLILAVITIINDFTTTTLINKITYVLIAFCFSASSVICREHSCISNEVIN